MITKDHCFLVYNLIYGDIIFNNLKKNNIINLLF